MNRAAQLSGTDVLPFHGHAAPESKPSNM